MEENLKVDEKFKRAFNLGCEVAKELDLKASMFQNESSDIILKSPIQAGMFQFVLNEFILEPSFFDTMLVSKNDGGANKQVLTNVFSSNMILSIILEYFSISKTIVLDFVVISLENNI